MSQQEQSGLIHGMKPEELTQKVLDMIGQGGNELWGKLQPEVRQWVMRQVFGQNDEKRKFIDKAAIDYLYSEDYERTPPTALEYLDNELYAGEVSKTLFPRWREEFLRICAPNSKIYEVNITGASGLGKTSFSNLILGYKLTRLFCIRDLDKFFNLQKNTKIYFGVYAALKTLAHDVGFDQLKNSVILSSPFFQSVYPPLDQGVEYVRWEQKPVEVILGSKEIHAKGKAVFAVAVDELNSFKQGNATVGRAQELVHEVSTRLGSRFLTNEGEIPGIAIYLSQTRTSSDFLEQRFRERRNTPGVTCIRGPRWAFDPRPYHREKNRGFRPDLGDPFFRVYIGSESSDPKILDTVEKDAEGKTRVAEIPGAMTENIESTLILKVPTVHYAEFLKDLRASLKNIGDVPSGAYTPFMPRHETIARAFTTDLIYPFSAQVIPAYERSTVRIQDVFNIKALTAVFMGKLAPIRHPNQPRYIALDLAQNSTSDSDMAGMAMVHPSGYTINKVIDAEDDQALVGAKESLKEVEVDFYVNFAGGPYGEPIDFRKIRVFIHWLKQCGYVIKLITTDRWQSLDFRQRLRDMGFETKEQSVDRTSQPYRTLLDAFNEGRIQLPIPPTDLPPGVSIQDLMGKIKLYQELTGLEYDVVHDKIDHRDSNPDGTRGSKDLSDAVASATYSCLTDTTGPIIVPQKRRASYQDSLNRYLNK